MYKAHSNVAYLPDNYVFNERFTVKSGRQFWIGNEPVFPKTGQVPLAYTDNRSIFGPIFVTNSMMPAVDNDGLRGAVRRLTSVRKPEIPGLHQQLIVNQGKMRELLGTNLVRWINHIQEHLYERVSTLPDPAVLRAKWSQIAMPKRQLRLAAMRDIHADGRDNHRTKVLNVQFKVKGGELLPNNKLTRGVADLTCPGSTVLGLHGSS